MVPAIAGGGIRHPAKLAESQGKGIDADNTSQVKDQFPDVDCSAFSIA